MNEAIKQAVDEKLAGAMAYDKAAKGFLSKKRVLAYILKRTVPEFESVSLDDIVDFYIEGTPEISTVPVFKDKSNAVRKALAKQDNEVRAADIASLDELIETATQLKKMIEAANS